MLFCSSQFVLFFLVVFGAYSALPWHRGRVLVLLAASFYFYACWNHWLALLLCVSALGDYLVALGMEATPHARMRKLLLALSLAGNLGLLCYFKYANFFLRSLEDAAGRCGLGLSLPMLRVILPVGISFYTFEAINYTIDVYRGKVKATRDLTHFLLFILFFPHLVAGPIVRARDFLPLVARRKRWSWLRAHTGVLLLLLGVVKKLAVADRMALYVDPVFADPAAYSTAALWLAAVAYALQIYCDFSGYSDMALGAGPPVRLSSRGQLQHAIRLGQRVGAAGGAGTSRYRPGFAITCSFRWAAAAGRGCKPAATCWRRSRCAGCGMGPAGPSSCGVSSTAFSWCCTPPSSRGARSAPGWMRSCAPRRGLPCASP